jgi:phospholipid-binding lipoprotein MlaA
MKSIHSILLMLCLVIIPLSSLADSFEASSASPSEETVGVEVALVSPETSKLGDLGKGIDTGVEPPVPMGASWDDTPLQVAIVYVPSPKPSAGEYAGTIPDPLEPVNRAFFYFNDKLYFWVLRPAASGYSAVVPEGVRVSVRNFFSNVTTPIRLVNCLLQANFSCAGTEALRFFLNTTVGVAGFFDPAKKDFKYEKKEKDFGQTLGVYGIGSGFYFVWPIVGPSSLRDTVGFVGDLFLDPQNYLIEPLWINLAVKSYYQINETSLTLGDYEDLKKGALDPYTALKDAYFQYRQSKIKEK